MVQNERLATQTILGHKRDPIKVGTSPDPPSTPHTNVIMFTNAYTSGFYHRDIYAEITKFMRPAKPMFDTKTNEIDVDVKLALHHLMRPNKVRIQSHHLRKMREMEEHHPREMTREELFP